MIKLTDILKEIAENKPKAIFLAGPAGAGKSYIIKQLIPAGKFNIINVDDAYEELLKASGVGLQQKDFGPEELSISAKMMGRAQAQTKEKYATLSKEKQNIMVACILYSEIHK